MSLPVGIARNLLRVREGFGNGSWWLQSLAKNKALVLVDGLDGLGGQLTDLELELRGPLAQEHHL